MSSLPAVTVVIPTRNRRRLLQATLASVLAQVDVELKAVVVNEASTDDTAEFLRSLHNPRVSVVTHATPRGPGGARDAGLAEVDTEWVAFTDDDDLWAPTKLATQLQAIRDDPRCSWSCVGAVAVDADLRPIAPQRLRRADDLLGRLLAVNVIPGGGSGVLVRTQVLREIGGFSPDPEIAGAEDWDCWIRLAQRSPVAVVDAPLLAYRIAFGSVSQNTARMHRSIAAVRSRHAELARSLGIDQHDIASERYLAGVESQAGGRLVPFRRLVAVARRDRRPGPLLEGLTVLLRLPPGMGPRRFLSHRFVDRRWFETADEWLSAFRAAPRG